MNWNLRFHWIQQSLSASNAIDSLTLFSILRLLKHVCPLQHQGVARCRVEECPFKSPQTHDMLELLILQTYLKVDALSEIHDSPQGLLCIGCLLGLVALQGAICLEDEIPLVPFLWNDEYACNFMHGCSVQSIMIHKVVSTLYSGTCRYR